MKEEISSPIFMISILAIVGIFCVIYGIVKYIKLKNKTELIVSILFGIITLSTSALYLQDMLN